MRQLASIQKILDIRPIDGADSIVVADILGWHVVVKKDEFKVGDLVIYCEVDSIVPERPEFEFLRTKKFRIRTVRLKSQISQGICFPLSILPQGEYVEGQDVTELLGIVKYEPEIYSPGGSFNTGIARGNFPSYVPKTDETRIQSMPWILEKYRGTRVVVCEKLDGSSITVLKYNGEIHVCSRQLDKKESETSKCQFWETARSSGIVTALQNSLLDNIAIQGELLGPGIQKNKYKLKEHQVQFFNAYDIREAKYLDYANFIELAHKLDFQMVPLLDIFTLEHTVDQLVDYSKGESLLYPTQREGIVIRPLIEIRDAKIGRLSFKVINPEFLLKHNE